MIIDQTEHQIVTPTKTWTRFEKILVGVIIILLLLRQLIHWPGITEMTFILLSFLAVAYLIFFYWIDKPEKATWRTVLITIFYGISFSLSSFSLVFRILQLTGALEMVLLTLFVFPATLLIDFVTGFRKKMVASNRIFIRAIVFTIIILLHYLVQ